MVIIYNLKKIVRLSDMTFSTRLFVKMFCKPVGTDQFGNVYYQSKKQDSSGKYKRIVLYKGMAESSKIPCLWHSWLHYTVDDIPNQVHDEDIDHIPNLTGTDYAYFPKKSGKEKVLAKYEAWKPL